MGNSVPINVPQVFIDSNNPSLAGFEPLKRSKVDVENACSPPASLPACSGAGTINGDVIVPCVHRNVGAFDIPAKTKPVFHDLNKVTKFCESLVGHYELSDEKYIATNFPI